MGNYMVAGLGSQPERAQWQTNLTTDFEAKSIALATIAPKLNTQSITRDLGNEKAAYDNEATRQLALTSFISEQMTKGLTYNEAWAQAKRERSDIFANMVRK
jgi:hypothetical protein